MERVPRGIKGSETRQQSLTCTTNTSSQSGPSPSLLSLDVSIFRGGVSGRNRRSSPSPRVHMNIDLTRRPRPTGTRPTPPLTTSPAPFRPHPACRDVTDLHRGSPVRPTTRGLGPPGPDPRGGVQVNVAPDAGRGRSTRTQWRRRREKGPG